ncbi:hypothetical protein CC2G_005255 [Coprinopsis cinerea AmutBmut pab1-1]|nr:hypothetical protein CC2G_005255 [Coprinopsis cinerea AmutBmut pab1-1]
MHRTTIARVVATRSRESSQLIPAIRGMWASRAHALHHQPPISISVHLFLALDDLASIPQDLPTDSKGEATSHHRGHTQTTSLMTIFWLGWVLSLSPLARVYSTALSAFQELA